MSRLRFQRLTNEAEVPAVRDAAKDLAQPIGMGGRAEVSQTAHDGLRGGVVQCADGIRHDQQVPAVGDLGDHRESGCRMLGGVVAAQPLLDPADGTVQCSGGEHRLPRSGRYRQVQRSGGEHDRGLKRWSPPLLDQLLQARPLRRRRTSSRASAGAPAAVHRERRGHGPALWRETHGHAAALAWAQVRSACAGRDGGSGSARGRPPPVSGRSEPHTRVRPAE